ncbi:RGS domain-containing serine/threonine-protein kinase A [Leucoagaricus sp. SymC.cos]|nr:RGS domain-containing serine/threonine-protein kinase A [Leucoagaricus sp. SymC.cos]
MDNGDLSTYLATCRNAPRVPLILDIISGIQHMHSLDIVHGDLKARNVLVSNSRRAMLADFGISHVPTTPLDTTMDIAGTFNWMAPELFNDGVLPTRESDIWAFSCTCYEMMTYKRPYHGLRQPFQVVGALVRGEIPRRPKRGEGTHEGYKTDEIWNMMEKCWFKDPKSRPKSDEIRRTLEKMKYPDSRPSLDPNISGLVVELAGIRYEPDIDYKHVLFILERVKDTSLACPIAD